jgi:tetratricopeptide (TPR) repeat protein
LLLGAVGHEAFAEDVVILYGEDGHSRKRSIGQIVDFTGEKLILRRPSGREETIAANRVVELTSEWCKEHGLGNARFEGGQYEEALSWYRQALAAEQRNWVRRLVLSRCVWCYRRLGRTEKAVEAFLLICREDPATPYFDGIPLAWTALQPSSSLVGRARTWLDGAQPAVARLVGASWLLSTRDRARATSVLRQLIGESEPRLAFLAEAQLWRTQVVTATPEDTERWCERIERMPTSIRAGPYYLLGRLAARHDRHEEAALAFLRIVILYPEQRELASRALLAAAGALEQMKQNDEAVRLYEELLGAYPESDGADEARRRWEALTREISKP